MRLPALPVLLVPAPKVTEPPSPEPVAAPPFNVKLPPTSVPPALPLLPAIIFMFPPAFDVEAVSTCIMFSESAVFVLSNCNKFWKLLFPITFKSFPTVASPFGIVIIFNHIKI